MRSRIGGCGVGVKFGAKIEIVRKFKSICHIRPPDGLDLFQPELLGGGSRYEAIAEQAHGTLPNGKQEFLLIFEIHVNQCSRQSRASGHLVDRNQIPAVLGVQGLSGIENLGAPALLLLFSSLGDIRHALNLRQLLTRCQ